MTGDKRITRNRISYSCQICRQRKVKCDKVHPACGSCQKAGEKCVYTLNEAEQQLNDDLRNVETNNSKKRKQATAQPRDKSLDNHDATRRKTDLEGQLLQLNSLLSRLSDATGVELGKKASKIDPGQSSGLHHEGLIRESQLSHSNGISSQDDSARDRPRDHTPNPGHQTDANHSPSVDSISAQLEQLTALLRNQQENIDRLDDPGHDTAHQPKVSLQPNNDETPWIDTKLSIPTEGQRNALFRCWLCSVYPVLPIVDPAITLLHFKALHLWYTHGLEKGVKNPVEHSVPLIYAIYYAGAMSMSLRGIQRWFSGFQRHHILDMFRRQFVLCLKTPAISFLNPLALAARTIMCYLSPQEDTGTGTTSLTASLIKTAYSLNLHRERTNEIHGRTVAELRRRLWWEMVNIDIREAAACNVPPSVDHRYCDTLMFGEIKDSRSDTPEAQQYVSAVADGQPPDVADDPTTSNRSSMISVFFLAMNARTLFASSTRQLLDIHLAVRPKTRADMVETKRILTEISRKVNSIIDRIPTKGLPELAFTPNGGKPGHSLALDHGAPYGADLSASEVEVMCGAVLSAQSQNIGYVLHHRISMTAFHKWTRIVLSMLIDQVHCLSFAPFLSNARSKFWIGARQCALRHAHACLRKFNSLATDLELERFRWAWSCLFQPIHACVIVLLDTYERPISHEASRSRALFDQMLSMSSPEYGIVGGINGLTSTSPIQGSGNESYDMLMQLRARAWHKAGLDPTVIWTEQDQIDVGVAKAPTSSERAARSMREDVILDVNTSSGRQENSQSDPYFKAMVEQRGKEVSHPAELGVPEESTSSSPPIMTYSGCDGSSLRTTAVNGQRFLRAKRRQQRTPYSNPSRGKGHKGEGHKYNFTTPTERFDVDQLIQKIQSVQKQASSQTAAQNSHSTNRDSFDSNADTATAATTQTLYEDVVNTNSDLETLLSQTPTHAPIVSNTDILQPHPSQSPPAAASHPNPLPDHDPDSNLTATTTTTPDLLATDFDWAKWDEIFGHFVVGEDEYAVDDSGIDFDFDFDFDVGLT